MDGVPPEEKWREKDVNKALRQSTLDEIGGVVSLNSVITAAVMRAKKKSIAEQGERGGSLYRTWHQHVGTKSNVFDEFRGILKELNISTDKNSPLMIELEEVWGTGYSLYFK